MFSVLIATAMPSLEGIIGLIGSLGLSMLGIGCPALIELLCLKKDDPGWMRWRLVKNILLLIFAIFIAVVGVYYSIMEIMSK